MTPKLQLIKSARDNSYYEAGLLRRRIQEFLQIKKRACRPATLKTYSSVLDQYAGFAGDNDWPPIWQDILAWLDHLEASGLTQATIHTYWVQLRTFLNFLEKMPLCDCPGSTCKDSA